MLWLKLCYCCKIRVLNCVFLSHLQKVRWYMLLKIIVRHKQTVQGNIITPVSLQIVRRSVGNEEIHFFEGKKLYMIINNFVTKKRIQTTCRNPESFSIFDQLLSESILVIQSLSGNTEWRQEDLFSQNDCYTRGRGEDIFVFIVLLNSSE